MLNSSHDQFKSSKINECVMRRRARNLRAKVKALLPVQICCRHHNRNRCVKEIQNNKKLWQSLSGKNNWKMCQQKQNAFYFENPPCINHYERFQKLTQAQIQQIKQDKLYYLGEDNLQDFQQFLKGKQKNAENLNDETQQIVCKTFEQFICTKTPIFFTNVRRNTQSCQSSPSFFLNEYNNNNSNKKLKSIDDQLKQFEQKRKIVLIQDKSKRIMDKVKLNMRLERAQIKLRQLKQKQNEEMKLKKQVHEEKVERATSRRRNMQKQGEIKQLQQKLRQNFLYRRSKTGKQVRTTRDKFKPFQTC